MPIGWIMEEKKEQGQETKIGEFAHHLPFTAIFSVPKKGISTIDMDT